MFVDLTKEIPNLRYDSIKKAVVKNGEVEFSKYVRLAVTLLSLGVKRLCRYIISLEL